MTVVFTLVSYFGDFKWQCLAASVQCSRPITWPRFLLPWLKICHQLWLRIIVQLPAVNDTTNESFKHSNFN